MATDGVAKSNNAATFGWYNPKEESFDGKNLKTGSFHGTNLIFPLEQIITQTIYYKNYRSNNETMLACISK
jgi:hypothetical protein